MQTRKGTQQDDAPALGSTGGLNPGIPGRIVWVALPKSLPRELLLELVRAGTQAPSADNGQPWRLCYDRERLYVSHDPALALRYDTHFRASLIAIGCLIENVVLAASAAGYEAAVEDLPQGGGPELAAILTFAPRAPREEPLSLYIGNRMTNRKPYATRPISTSLEAELAQSVSALPGLRLELLTSRPAKRACARLVMSADRFRYEQQAFHEELFRTIRLSQEEVERTRDGLSLTSLELGWTGEILLKSIRPWRRAAVLHKAGLSRAMAFHSYLSVLRSAGVALLRTPGTDPLDALRLGRGLQHLWLDLTRLGLAAQPLSLGTLLLLEVPDEPARASQARLRRKLGALFPAGGWDGLTVLLRFGSAAPPAARSLRRPVEDVLRISGG